MNCSTLQEQAAGSLPSASQVSLQIEGEVCTPTTSNDALSCCLQGFGHAFAKHKQRRTRQAAERTQPIARTGRRICRHNRWAEAHEKIARMTLTIKLDRNWSSFQLANSAPPLSVTDGAIAPSARIHNFAVSVRSKQIDLRTSLVLGCDTSAHVVGR